MHTIHELAAQGMSLHAIARQLGLAEAASLLQQTLNEENVGSHELTLISRSMVNIQVRVKWAAAGA